MNSDKQEYLLLSCGCCCWLVVVVRILKLHLAPNNNTGQYLVITDGNLVNIIRDDIIFVELIGRISNVFFNVIDNVTPVQSLGKSMR